MRKTLLTLTMLVGLQFVSRADLVIAYSAARIAVWPATADGAQWTRMEANALRKIKMRRQDVSAGRAGIYRVKTNSRMVKKWIGVALLEKPGGGGVQLRIAGREYPNFGIGIPHLTRTNARQAVNRKVSGMAYRRIIRIDGFVDYGYRAR